MKIASAKRDFIKYLASRQRPLKTLTPADGIDSMLDFYSETPAKGTLLEDGDMLLYQWGTYDWGEGRLFELDITRQLIGGVGDDEDIFQLSLTFRFAPTTQLSLLGKGDQWCQSSTHLEAFRSFILSSAPFLATKDLTPASVSLEYGVAG